MDATNRSLLDRLLRPRSVAIVGVSPERGHMGGSVLANLERCKFDGDIHLVSLKPELERLVVPSKYYGVAAAARPVLFSKDGEIARLIRENQCGFAVPSGEANKLVSHILEIARNPQLGRKMGERGRASFEQYWDQAHALQHWEQLIANVSACG